MTIIVPWAISKKSVLPEILLFLKVPYDCGKKLSTASSRGFDPRCLHLNRLSQCSFEFSTEHKQCPLTLDLRFSLLYVCKITLLFIYFAQLLTCFLDAVKDAAYPFEKINGNFRSTLTYPHFCMCCLIG